MDRRSFLASLTALVGAQALALPRNDAIYVGSVAMDIPTEMIRRLTPLTHFLGKSLNRSVYFKASPDLNSAVSDFGVNVTQIAYFTPVAYLEARDRFHAKPIAAPLTHGTPALKLVVVVRADSGINSVAELKGKRFAFGDPGALLQRAVVVASGLPLETIGEIAFLKHYDNIAKAVLNRDFDAGILKDTIAEAFADKGLRAIHISPPLPSYVFAANRHVDVELFAQLRKAFLSLDPGEPGSRFVLSQLDPTYDGFAAVSDSDYDVIRRLIAPFKKSSAAPSPG